MYSTLFQALFVRPAPPSELALFHPKLANWPRTNTSLQSWFSMSLSSPGSALPPATATSTQGRQQQGQMVGPAGAHAILDSGSATAGPPPPSAAGPTSSIKPGAPGTGTSLLASLPNAALWGASNERPYNSGTGGKPAPSMLKPHGFPTQLQGRDHPGLQVASLDPASAYGKVMLGTSAQSATMFPVVSQQNLKLAAPAGAVPALAARPMQGQGQGSVQSQGQVQPQAQGQQQQQQRQQQQRQQQQRQQQHRQQQPRQQQVQEPQYLHMPWMQQQVVPQPVRPTQPTQLYPYQQTRQPQIFRQQMPGRKQTIPSGLGPRRGPPSGPGPGLVSGVASGISMASSSAASPAFSSAPHSGVVSPAFPGAHPSVPGAAMRSSVPGYPTQPATVRLQAAC